MTLTGLGNNIKNDYEMRIHAYFVILILLFSANILNAQSSKGRLKIEVGNNDNSSIPAGFGKPGCLFLLIYTGISDLEIDISSSQGEPMIGKPKYDEYNERFIVALEDSLLRGGFERKYRLIIRHPNYHPNNDFQMTIEDFFQGKLILYVDEELPESLNKKMTPEELFKRGMNYYRGDGEGQGHDYLRAFNLFKIAAEQGHPDAQYYLGYMYEKGLGDIRSNLTKAKVWYRKAAAQNQVSAIYALDRLARQPATVSRPQPRKFKSRSIFSNVNFEPIGDPRPLGVAVGYASKQLKESYGKYPWCYVGEDKEKSFSSSWNAGMYWAPEFGYGMGFQTGVYFEFSLSEYNIISIFECNLSFPLRFQFRYEIVEDLSVFFYTGPCFDFSLAYNMTDNGEKISLYSLNEDLRRFNMLWGVGVGLRWKWFQIMVGGDWGMTSIFRNDSLGTKLNKPFGVTISYNGLL